MLFLRFTAAVCFACSVLACGDGDNPREPQLTWGPASNQLYTPSEDDVGGVVGHWFPCDDAVCSQFGLRGFGFEENGRVSLLEYRYEDGGADYCEYYQQDSYRYEDGKLSYIADDHRFGSRFLGTFSFLITGRDAWMDEALTSNFMTGRTGHFRRVPRAPIGFCRCKSPITADGFDPCVDERPPAPR